MPKTQTQWDKGCLQSMSNRTHITYVSEIKFWQVSLNLIIWMVWPWHMQCFVMLFTPHPIVLYVLCNTR